MRTDVDRCVDVCVDTCVGRGADTCIAMCVDMHVNIWTDTGVDMCAGMLWLLQPVYDLNHMSMDTSIHMSNSIIRRPTPSPNHRHRRWLSTDARTTEGMRAQAQTHAQTHKPTPCTNTQAHERTRAVADTQTDPEGMSH